MCLVFTPLVLDVTGTLGLAPLARLPRIKRQELFESQHESGRDVQDIQAPCTECLGMQGTQALGFGHDRRERG